MNTSYRKHTIQTSEMSTQHQKISEGVLGEIIFTRQSAEIPWQPVKTTEFRQHTLIGSVRRSVTHNGDLAGLFAGPNAQLVDSRLGDVGPLLGLVQLVLDLPETHCIGAHLLLLLDT